MGRRARSVLPAVALLAAAGTLAACSAPVEGAVGMLLDSAGRPVVAAAWCDDHWPERIVFDTTRDGRGPAIALNVPEARGNYGEVLVGRPPADWPGGPAATVFESGRVYTAGAGLHGAGAAAGVRFSVGMLRGNGQILWAGGSAREPAGVSVQDGPGASAEPSLGGEYLSPREFRRRVRSTYCG